MQPAQIAGQQPQHRRSENDKPDSAETLRHGRLNLPRSKPANSQHTKKERQKKSSDAEKLQGKVRDDRSDHADPVARNVSSGEYRGAVQRGIKRRIRSQREEKEERRDAQHETDQLIQPPIARRDKDACQKTHVGRFSHRTQNSPVPQIGQSLIIMPRSERLGQCRNSTGVYSWLPAGLRLQNRLSVMGRLI